MGLGSLNHDKKDLNDDKKSKEVSYLAVGIALGAAVGAAVKNIGLGLALGLAIGAGLDAKKFKKNE